MKRAFFIMVFTALLIPILFTSVFAEGATIKEGDKAPDFLVESTEGKSVSLKDFAGKKVVLYFYPKDDTAG